MAYILDLERLDDNDAEYHKELRHRCQTDGLFLAPLLGYHDFVPRLHQPVVDLYIQKQPGLSIDAQHPIKNRMHLDPRHTFKTSYKNVDTTQWIITFPDITIANITATKSLATKLTRRQAVVFLRRKNRPLTVFQKLWPEYLIDKLTGTYTAPCRLEESVEPTLYSTSVGSTQSGEHPWIWNSDDPVDTENSGIDASDESRNRVWNSYSTNINTLRLGGYNNICGTRYHPFDLYGRLLGSMDTDEWKTLIRSSVRVIDGERLVEGEWPKPHEMELLFPELLSYQFLKGKFLPDYRSFMCQQQNDPQGGGVAAFPKYAQCAVREERLPSTGEVRICWRLASDAKDFMKNYAEGAAVLYQGNRCYVVDAWRGVFTLSELCIRIIRGCKRHSCGELIIERTPGSESVIPHIQNEGTRQNWSVQIEQPEFESDDSRRKGRCRQMEPLQKAGRFWVSTGSGQYEEMKRQFTNFGLIEQNGLVDTISRLVLKWPTSVLAGEVTAEQREMYRAAAEQNMFEVIYGAGGRVEIEQALQQEQQPKATNSYGLTPMLGGLDG